MLEEIADFLTAPMRRRHRIWQVFAEGRGGQFHPPAGGFFTRRPASIDVPFRDALVHVDTYTQSNGKTSQTFTRFRASYVLPVGPAFRVFRAHLFSPLARSLGFQDVPLGDPRFDQDYIVKTNDPEATRRAWTEAARTSMRCASYGTARADGHVVKFNASGALKDPALMSVLCDLVGELACYALDWLDPLKAMPDARFVPPRGAWDERWTPSVSFPSRGSEEVRVYPTLHAQRMALCAAARTERALADFAVSVGEDGTLAEPVPEPLRGADMAARLRAAGPGNFSHSGHYLRYVLDGATDARRVRNAVSLLDELAGGGTRKGAFR